MKVDDIRPASVLVGQRAAMQADIDWLAKRQAAFVIVNCPACAAKDFENLYEKYCMQQVRCRECETQFINPRPSEEILAAFYAQSANYAYWARNIFPASKEARREKIFQPRAAYAAGLVRKAGIRNGVLVEVGAAYGQFCSEVVKTGVFSRVIAIEPTPDLAGVCRGLGIEVLESPYESVLFDTPVDFIASFEVIEHLFDPGAFMAWCHDALRPGGMVLLTCPNIAGFETLLLGRASGAVDHEHMNLFTPQSLAQLAERCGFIEIEVTTPGELDVDLVQRALKAGEIGKTDLGPLVIRLVEGANPKHLQSLIQEASLSSNMRMIARKPKS